MSYIYALHFTKFDAVKIGKADNLENRVRHLISIWGAITPNKAYAFEIDDLLVLGKEHTLHILIITISK